jgi:hypothetical protein
MATTKSLTQNNMWYGAQQRRSGYSSKSDSERKYKQLHIILGVVNDKNLDEVLPLFPKEAIYYFANQTYLEDWMQLSFKKKQPNLT